MSTIRNVWAVFLREMGSYFLSPAAYVVLFLFLATHGAIFYVSVLQRTGDPWQVTSIVDDVFGFALVWVLFLSPLVTMKLFAEERRTGSFEVLMTAPVTEWQVVAGKFLAAQAFYFLVWLGLLPFFGMLEVLGNPDWGPILATYCGLFFLGSLTNALGILASTLTRNQLVSAMLALAGNLFFFLLSILERFFPEDPDARRFIHYVSFTRHFAVDFSNGVIDPRYLFFYAGFAALFLFLSVRSLEARKWL